MFLDDDPGWLPGWGPVLADIARQIAFDQKTNPAWKWSATNDSGQLLHHGHTKTPTHSRRNRLRQSPRPHLPGTGLPAPRHCAVMSTTASTTSKADPPTGARRVANVATTTASSTRKASRSSPSDHPDTCGQPPTDASTSSPGDGNIVAIEDATENDDGNGWDLNDAQPPREIRQIIPAEIQSNGG